MSKLSELHRRRYENTLLIIGILLLSYSVNELRTLWASPSSLFPITGTLKSATISTSPVVDRKGHRGLRTELIFYLNESDKRFAVSENKADDYYSKDFGYIIRGLRSGKTIRVWIRESEKDEQEPKVFQIDKDEITILSFEKVQLRNSSFTAVLLFFGLGFIVAFIWLRFPDKLRKIFE